METTQAKPLRRRRRRLIGAFVLLLVSLSSGWYWPRGDARFVGKWDVSVPKTGAGALGTIEFRSNGIGSANIPFSLSNVFIWRFENSQLVCGPRLAGTVFRRSTVRNSKFQVRIAHAAPGP